MRSDWQTHCLVITVWWTFIVFRLVETETCCALACSTNANLFHVDIISHCLHSNHNTCLTFLHNENVLLRVYFITGSEEGWRELKGYGQGLLVLFVAFNITYVKLFYIFLGDVHIKCQKRKTHQLWWWSHVKFIVREGRQFYFWDNTYLHSFSSEVSLFLWP